MKPSKEVIEIGIEDFITSVVPKVHSIEAFVDNTHSKNLMTLVSPQYEASKNIFQWNNNFSWSYNGNITDSMKERVKSAGGKVDGVLRFSIQWNEENDNKDDLDAHCIEPNGNRIMFNNKRSHTGGNLDIDITALKGVAVENITFPTLTQMLEGDYEFIVNNFSARGALSGFTAEIEYDGKIYHYSYPKPLKQKEDILVAKIHLSKKNGLTFYYGLDATESTKSIWNIQTKQYIKVNMMMFSPNYWDGQECGNKHYFFTLDNCQNPEKVRGFYNEFLMQELLPHRKTFEVLSSKMMCENDEVQLSGLGFSSTQRNTMLLRTKGTLTRAYKIQF